MNEATLEQQLASAHDLLQSQMLSTPPYRSLASPSARNARLRAYDVSHRLTTVGFGRRARCRRGREGSPCRIRRRGDCSHFVHGTGQLDRQASLRGDPTEERVEECTMRCAVVRDDRGCMRLERREYGCSIEVHVKEHRDGAREGGDVVDDIRAGSRGCPDGWWLRGSTCCAARRPRRSGGWRCRRRTGRRQLGTVLARRGLIEPVEVQPWSPGEAGGRRRSSAR